MVELSRFFDIGSYTEAQFAEVLHRLVRTNGYIVDIGNNLSIIAHGAADMSVDMNTGEAWVEGAWYQNTALKNLAISAANPTNPRYDRVVLHLEWASDSIVVTVLTGTPAASPVVPSLTQTAAIWEISLANIYVAAGVTTIVAGNITNNSTVCAGWGGLLPWTQTTAFTSTAPSTSTITMTSNLTGSILVGYPIKFMLNGSYYYAVCTAITSNLLTIAGAPLTTGANNLQELWYGTFPRVEQFDIVVNGYYEDATNTALMASDLSTYLKWNQAKAYCVMYKVISKVHDSGGTHGKATVMVNGADVNSSAGGLVIAADDTWYSTVVDINTANYDINNGEMIELNVTKGTTGDATDLTVSMVFVFP